MWYLKREIILDVEAPLQVLNPEIFKISTSVAPGGTPPNTGITKKKIKKNTSALNIVYSC